MNNKNDIIVLYGPTFDQPAQLSKHQFARMWAEERKVLYIESPFNIFSFITRFNEAKRLLKRYITGPEKFYKNLWLATFFYILPYRGSKKFLGAEWVNRLNQYLIKYKLNKMIKRLNLYKPILFIGDAHAYPLLKYFNNNLKIYHCSDDYTLVPSYPESFKNLEKKFIKKCDIVIATAEELKKSKIILNQNTYTIPNGADVEHFKKTQNQNTIIADDIKNFTKPVVGYIGSIFRWINVEWIEYAAKNLPNYSFVFIGPITINISKLKKIDNIFFLGPRPYLQLPTYLKGFDLATIPFTIDGVTLKASPIKFYEYLASGVPIVSTDLPDLEQFKNIVSLVKDKEQYCRQIQLEISNNNSQLMHKRINTSNSFSWKARYTKINELFDFHLLNKI